MKKEKRKKKLVRITTVSLSLEKLLPGQMNYMSQYYEVIAISSDAPVLKQVGKMEGVRTFCVKMTRKITPVKDLLAILKLWLFLMYERPWIVHTHTPKAGMTGMIAAWLAGVPNRLHTVAGMPLMEAEGSKKEVLVMVEKLTYAMATHVYPNSHGLEDYILENRFCPEKKLKVIANGSSNGIDTNYFSREQYPPEVCADLRSQMKIGPNDLVFCFVGRVVKQKGVEELTEAFAALHRKYDFVKLVIVGPPEEALDPLGAYIWSIMTSHPAIIRTGYRKDVRPLMAMSDVFVLPSYREGLPNVLLQAGAMDLPCITTDTVGCNEIIQNRKNGLLVQVKSTWSLHDAMETMVKDVELRKKMSVDARRMVVDMYEQRYLWQKLHEEYLALGRQ